MSTSTVVFTWHRKSRCSVVIKRIRNFADQQTKKQLVQHCRLLSYSELEEWQQVDSKLIQSGYRQAMPSVAKCIHSWTYLHNESVNIFSHLLGAILYIMLGLVVYTELSKQYVSMTLGDALALGVLVLGISICFLFSAMFHTCAAHSHEGYQLSRQIDFQGIIILVVSTSAPQLYYTFYTEPTIRTNYWLLIAFFGLLASVGTYNPAFYKPSRHSMRVGVFAGLGLSTFAPLMHGLYLHGWAAQSQRFPLWAVGLTHTFNVLGAVVYVTHFPERWWPKTFDIFGASHQLMHCAIVGAALTLLAGTIIAFENAHAEGKAQGMGEGTHNWTGVVGLT